MKFLAICGLVLAAVSVQAQANRVVLGRYAQTMETVPIHKSANGASRVYYRAKPYEYICVNFSPNPNYLKVTMSNGVLPVMGTTMKLVEVAAKNCCCNDGAWKPVDTVPRSAMASVKA